MVGCEPEPRRRPASFQNGIPESHVERHREIRLRIGSVGGRLELFFETPLIICMVAEGLLMMTMGVGYVLVTFVPLSAFPWLEFPQTWEAHCTQSASTP